MIIENESIFSSQNRDLRCICTHPRPLSSFEQRPLRESCDKGIIILESVIRCGWLVISGRGSGSHIAVSGNVALGGIVLVIRVSGHVLTHVSFSRMTSVSVRKGACPVELSSSCRLRMKFEVTGWRKRATGLPRSLSLSL